MKLTEDRDLRTGRPCWVADERIRIRSDPLPIAPVDIAIVGCGIMGAMLAERLGSSGRSVALVDRRPPAHGSTAASTALVMWAADVPLTHLGRSIGAAEAGRRWRRVQGAVRRLRDRIDRAGIDCGRVDRPELYLAGKLLDEAALGAEGAARREAGLPSNFLDAAAVAARFGLKPRCALLSAGSYDLDPVRLTVGLLDLARGRGATLTFPADVVALEEGDRDVVVRIADGRSFAARQAILATGYERARRFLPPAFEVSSSYAIATPKGIEPLWQEGAMIWEASKPYVYARGAPDGRVIAGGEDGDFADAAERDALLEAKSRILGVRLAALAGNGQVVVDCAWAAAFGSSPDGLPAIGRASGQQRTWLASGFGGNGVSFAALATELIEASLSGHADPDATCFDPYRFGPADSGG